MADSGRNLPGSSQASKELISGSQFKLENIGNGTLVRIQREGEMSVHFCKMLADLHDNKVLPDVSVVCGDETLQGHQLVLAMNSGYFWRVFQEAPSKHPIVLLRDVDSSMFKNILEFLYTGKVALSKGQVTEFVKIADELEIYWDLTNRPKAKVRREND